MEIDMVPRRVPTPDRVVQVKVTVPQGSIVHRESPSRDQVTAPYLVRGHAGRNVSRDDAPQGGIAEVEAAPRAFPAFQDGEPFLDGDAAGGEEGVVHARDLGSQEILQVLRARDDGVQPPRGLRAGPDVAQGSVGEDLDDQFGGEVQELG